MEIVFHPHAIEKLAKRNLDKSAIKEGINNPDRVIEGKDRRKIAQKVYGRYIITAYLARPQRYVK